MSLEVTSDRITSTPSSWDWKASYVERMADGAGLELFTESSVTPDTMLLVGGPPRLTQVAANLSPIGLVTDVNITVDNQLKPNWEMGTDFTYFTRGKTINTMQIGAMVANKASLMRLLSRESPRSSSDLPTDNVGPFWMNLDSETMASPFGVMVLFNAKGGLGDDQGSRIGSVYLEHCNIGNFSFGMNSQAVFMQENVSIMFDRIVPVDYN